jgi:His-Xaa-Ser system radical SAM maturase HxsC
MPVVGRVTTNPITDEHRLPDHIALIRAENPDRWKDLSSYAGVIADTPVDGADLPTILRPQNLEYLGDGDVVLLYPSGETQVLYRRSSENNTVLTTERCNSFCLMCSQPPNQIDDSWRVDVILRLIELIDPAAREIILSGGEPTLLGDDFFRIVLKFSEFLPNTALHILTNGRTFSDRGFASRIGRIQHPDLMLGIPLYSDVDSLHDYVVQAKGAWAQTLEGFYNLARAGVRLELRVVLHQQTYRRLPQLAEFIYRNLPFVEHVALMGLEMFGFTNLNISNVWIDPLEYAEQLEAATKVLAMRGMNVSIYNHQLCTLPRTLWPFARKSISDWKNVYLEECATCGVREFCGGFFQSARKRHSAHISPLPTLSEHAKYAMRQLAGIDQPLERTLASDRF